MTRIFEKECSISKFHSSVTQYLPVPILFSHHYILHYECALDTLDPSSQRFSLIENVNIPPAHVKKVCAWEFLCPALPCHPKAEGVAVSSTPVTPSWHTVCHSTLERRLCTRYIFTETTRELSLWIYMCLYAPACYSAYDL